MTNENTQNNETENKKKLPSHEVFMVVEDSREGKSARWIKIGAAWKQKGDGFGIKFDGDFVLRPKKEKTEDNGAE